MSVKAVAILLILAVGSTVAAQGRLVESHRLMIDPASTPSPALRYQLLPPIEQRTAGNAAVLYGKVFSQQQALMRDREVWSNLNDWLELPIQDILNQSRIQDVTSNGSLFSAIREASKCRHADWQIPLDDPEVKAFLILLPEVQETRQVARLTALRARRQIAEGDYAGAVESLQSGYAIARHVSAGRTVVNALVGFSIVSMMNDQLLDLIQQPEAPNLYHAIAFLPKPLIDLTPAIEFEFIAFEKNFHQLRRVYDMGLGEAYWDSQLESFWNEAQMHFGDSAKEAHGHTLPDLVARGTPIARDALSKWGWSDEELEEMPVGRLLLLHTVELRRRQMQEAAKWMYVDGREALTRIKLAAEKATRAFADGEDVFPGLHSGDFPLYAARLAEMRTWRMLSLIQTVEAIRCYAANHQGNLPENLSAIEDVIVPKDPLSGNAFRFSRGAKSVTLSAPPYDQIPSLAITLICRDE